MKKTNINRLDKKEKKLIKHSHNEAEKFHWGIKDNTVLEYDIKGYKGNLYLAGIGELKQLVLSNGLVCSFKNTHLAYNPKTKRLFILGATTDLAREQEIKVGNKIYWYIGEIEKVIYRTKKDEQGINLWEHRFKKPLPILAFDKYDQIIILGGSYTIEDRGIVD